MILTELTDKNSRIDFYAGNERVFRLLRPLYDAMPAERRGTFYAGGSVKIDEIPIKKFRNKLEGFDPIVIASYKDLNDIFYAGEMRAFIMLEPEYTTEVRGLLKMVSMFLCGDNKSYQWRRVSSKNAVLYKSYKDAVAKLLDYVNGKEAELVKEVNGHSVGMIYMGWGEKALQAIRKSILSLKRLGYKYPVTVVGDFPNKPPKDAIPSEYNNVPCEQSPFDMNARAGFRFRAGRIKPLLYNYSPYEYTMYLDADTHFIQPVHSGFELLNDYDIAVTEEKLTLAKLYNKARAGWELNIQERDITVIELGGDESRNFINSGVIFFRKSKATKQLFGNWHKEWMRFQEWDEQLALMRAIEDTEVKVKYLPVQWNDPWPNEDSYIFHNYGRGVVRANV